MIAPKKYLASLLLLGALFQANLTGCGRTEPPPPVDDTRMSPNSMNGRAGTPQKAGMSTGTKVVLLAGAAAAYYMYKHHQTTSAQGQDGQYYLSKNGRVYYRDSEHRAHWVTPPAEGLRIPESEARDYQQFQGYDGNSSGRDLVGLADDANE